MRKLFVPALALLVLTYAMLAQAQRGGGPPTMPPEPGSLPSRNFEKVAEGVYYATSTGSITTVSNVVLVVNDEDVLIVDPGEATIAIFVRRGDAYERAEASELLCVSAAQIQESIAWPSDDGPAGAVRPPV